MEIAHGLQQTKGPERGLAAEKRPTANELRQAERTGKEPMREKLKEAIFPALEGKPTMQEYEKRLQAQDITPLPNIASIGRMNGYAYEIDGICFKGSQLGREYSWSALQKRGLQYDGPGVCAIQPIRRQTQPHEQMKKARQQKKKRLARRGHLLYMSGNWNISRPLAPASLYGHHGF